MLRYLSLVLIACGASSVNGAPRVDSYGDALPDGAVARLGSSRFRPAAPRFGKMLVAVTPDNQTLLTAEWRGVRFWDLSSGRETGFVLIPGGDILELAVSPDGKRFAASVDDYGAISRPFGPDSHTLHVGDFATQKILWKTNTVEREQYAWNNLGFTNDGKLLLARRVGMPPDHRCIVVFDAASGQIQSSHDGMFSYSVAPDGKTIAFGHKDGEVLLLGTAGMKTLAKPKVLNGPIHQIAWTSDGKRIAVGGGCVPMAEPDVPPKGDFRVCVWDIAASRELHSFKWGFNGKSLSFSPDDRFLCARENEEDVSVWDLGAGKLFWKGQLINGTQLIEAGDQATLSLEVVQKQLLRINKTEKGKVQWTWWPLKQAPQANAVLSPDCKTFVDARRGLALIDIATGKDRADHGGHRFPVGTLRPSSDGKLLISMDERYFARVWDLKSGQLLFDNDRSLPLAGKDFINGGRQIVSLGKDGAIRIDDCATKSFVRSFEIKGAFYPETWKEGVSADRNIFAVSDQGLLAVQTIKSVEIWDASKAMRLAHLPDFESQPISTRFSPDGNHLVVESRQQVRLCTARGEELARWQRVRKNEPNALFSGDSKRLAWLDAEKLVVAPVANPKQVETLAGVFESFELSADGLLIVLYDRARAIRAVEIATLKEVRTQPQDDEQWTQQAVRFRKTVSGRLLADVSLDPKHSQWALIDPVSGKKLVPSADGFGPIDISPDGRLVVAGSGEIELYEALTGKRLGKFPDGHRGQVTSVAFTPDSRQLITGGSEGTILVWDWPAACGLESSKAEPMEALWRDLRDADPNKAYRAIFAMKNAPAETIAFMRIHLSPAKESDAARIRDLIGALDADDFRKRSAASKELSALGADAEPFLRTASLKPRSAELEKGIQKLLADPRVHELSSDSIRAFRAIEVLERIGSDEARKLLNELAIGAPGMPVTREAQSRLKGAPK